VATAAAPSPEIDPIQAKNEISRKKIADYKIQAEKIEAEIQKTQKKLEQAEKSKAQASTSTKSPHERLFDVATAHTQASDSAEKLAALDRETKDLAAKVEIHRTNIDMRTNYPDLGVQTEATDTDASSQKA